MIALYSLNRMETCDENRNLFVPIVCVCMCLSMCASVRAALLCPSPSVSLLPNTNWSVMRYPYHRHLNNFNLFKSSWQHSSPLRMLLYTCTNWYKKYNEFTLGSAFRNAVTTFSRWNWRLHCWNVFFFFFHSYDVEYCSLSSSEVMSHSVQVIKIIHVAL